MVGITAGNFSADHTGFAFFCILFLLIVFLCFSLLNTVTHPFTVSIFKFKNFLGFISAGGMIFFIGFLGIQAQLYPDLPENHISYFTGSQKYNITGRIMSFARNDHRKIRYVLDCNLLETETAQIPVTGKIHVSIYGFPDDSVQFGDMIRFKAKIKPIRNFNNPGGFDYQKFLLFQGVYGSAWTDAKKIRIVSSASDQKDILTWTAAKIEHHRVGFYRFILSETQDSDAGKILVSLVAGKKEVLPDRVRDLYAKAGISHLLAISGLHLSIVSLLFFSFFYWVLSFFPYLLISAKAKKAAGILTLVPLLLYAVFTGFSPSTQRAALMIAVVMILFVSEKQKDVLSTLSIAGICILLLNAAALFSISFQLSFMAVGFIIAGLFLVRKLDITDKTNLMYKTGMMMVVTVSAGLGTAPLTAYYFNMVSGVGIISNLVFIPLIGFVVLPLGLIAMMSFSIVPVFSTKLIFICHKLIQFSIFACEKLITIPFSWAHTVTPTVFELVLMYLFMTAVFCLIMQRKKTGLVLWVCVLAGIFIQWGMFKHADNKNKGLQITVLDVGQGNSALIQTLEKQNILVDGGGFSGFSSFDTGRYIVAPFLWKKRIRQLDYVILTHPEGDHLNGLVYILDNFRVGTLIKNHDQIDTPNYSRLMDICQSKGVAIRYPAGKVDVFSLNSAQMIFMDARAENEFGNLNENSLVFKLVYDRFSMLFTGDILQEREKSVSGLENLESDILLAPHHGSRTSSSKFFLDKVRPGSVIISCGMDNRYGFPHAKVLKRYADRGIKIFRTDNDGAVLISSDGQKHTITTRKGG